MLCIRGTYTQVAEKVEKPTILHTFEASMFQALKLCERYNVTIIQPNNTANKHLAGSDSKQTFNFMF